MSETMANRVTSTAGRCKNQHPTKRVFCIPILTDLDMGRKARA